MSKFKKTMAVTVAVASFVLSVDGAAFAKDKIGSLPAEKQQKIIDALYNTSVPNLFTMNGKYSIAMDNKNYGKKDVQDMPSSITSSGSVLLKYAKDKDTYELGLDTSTTLGKNDANVKLAGTVSLVGLSAIPNTKIYGKLTDFKVTGNNLKKYDKDGQSASITSTVQMFAGKWFYLDIAKFASTNKDFQAALKDKSFQEALKNYKEILNNPQAAYKSLGLSEAQLKSLSLTIMKDADYTENADGSITISANVDAKTIKQILSNKQLTDAIVKNSTLDSSKLGLDAKLAAEYKKTIDDAIKNLNITALSYSETIKNGVPTAYSINYKFSVKEQDPDTYTTTTKKVGKKNVTQKVKKAGGYMVSNISVSFSSTFDYTKADLEDTSKATDILQLTGGLTNLK